MSRSASGPRHQESDMPMGSSDRISVGVLLERAIGERRVALIPADIKKLMSKATFVIESGAGLEAGFDDKAYADAGARIANLREVLLRCRHQGQAARH